MSFTIPADQLELLQTAGMAVMGHGIELLEMTFSDEPVAAPAESAAPSDSADNAGTPTEEPTAGETVAPSDSTENVETPAETTAPTKGNPDTGVSGIAAVAGAAVIAAGVLFATRRK